MLNWSALTTTQCVSGTSCAAVLSLGCFYWDTRYNEQFHMVFSIPMFLFNQYTTSLTSDFCQFPYICSVADQGLSVAVVLR